MPSEFTLFGLTFHFYGMIIALGIGLAILAASRRETRLGLPKDTALDMLLTALPFAIIGARLYYVAFSWETFRNNPVSILYIWQGGLAFYGGLIGGLIGGFIFARVRKLPFGRLLDLAAPSFAIGQAVGRWGNFVNQEAYGIVSPIHFFPLSVFIEADGQWHCATFFYESVWCLLIAILLTVLERRGRFHRKGEVFRAYLFLYAFERFFVEGLRTDSLCIGSLRVSQMLSLAVLSGCIVHAMLSKFRKKV